MQFLRGAISLVSVLVLASCETPFPSRSDDPDARYGLKPRNGNASNLDSDNVYAAAPQRRNVVQSSPVPASDPGVQLKPFRSTQPLAPAATPRPRATPTPTPTPRVKPSPTPRPRATPRVEETTSREDSPPTEPAARVPEEKAPFALPVPGKKGYVTSPFSPDAGFIDVTGMEPGTEAKDPYTGKVFRVP